jgi:hypothetical protein
MKFLCVDCDEQMFSGQTASPGDGTLSLVFRCPSCDRSIAMLTNPMETQMVNSLCVEVGGRTEPEQPFESISRQLETGGGSDARGDGGREAPTWTVQAEERLARVPGFVRGMVRRLYVDWAQSRGVLEITVEVMDEAKAELGLEEI